MLHLDILRSFARNSSNEETLYVSLVQSLRINVVRKDMDDRFVFVNRAFCNLLGLPAEEILGKTDYDFYAPELADKCRADDKRVQMENLAIFTS